MENNCSIVIEQVSNGFIIKPLPGYREVPSLDETQVFQSFAELETWLSNHFDHRSDSISIDIVK